MPYYRTPSGSIVEMDPPARPSGRERFQQQIDAGELVEVFAVKRVPTRFRSGGYLLVEDEDAAPVATPTPADAAPSSTDKAELLAQLEALGASNLATLRRYSVERLTEELDKLTAPEE